jgi:hypothetical protein
MNLCSTSCFKQFPDPDKPLVPVSDFLKEVGGAVGETVKSAAGTGGEVFWEFIKPLLLPLGIVFGGIAFIVFVYYMIKAFRG